MTRQQRGRLLFLASGRAVPRLAAAALGFALVGTGSALLGALGCAILIASIMTNWARWWHYVRTGTRPQVQPAAEFTERGSFAVELQDPGTRPINVMRALREVTGAGLSDAKSWVDGAPATFANGLSEESARRVRDRVERAGATASMTATGGI